MQLNQRNIMKFMISITLISVIQTCFFTNFNMNFLYIMMFKYTFFKLGSDRNFCSFRGSAGFNRFGSAKILPNFLAFDFMLTYNILTIYAILCNKSFSQSQLNATIHIWTIKFYVVKLSACCGEGFYMHALIL